MRRRTIAQNLSRNNKYQDQINRGRSPQQTKMLHEICRESPHLCCHTYCSTSSRVVVIPASMPRLEDDDMPRRMSRHPTQPPLHAGPSRDQRVFRRSKPLSDDREAYYSSGFSTEETFVSPDHASALYPPAQPWHPPRSSPPPRNPNYAHDAHHRQFQTHMHTYHHGGPETTPMTQFHGYFSPSPTPPAPGRSDS